MTGRQNEARGDSFIVSKFGLDGVREHYMPGNRRRGTGVREKRAFESEAVARAWLDACGWRDNAVYQCSICGMWHTASPGRIGGQPRPGLAPAGADGESSHRGRSGG